MLHNFGKCTNVCASLIADWFAKIFAETVLAFATEAPREPSVLSRKISFITVTSASVAEELSSVAFTSTVADSQPIFGVVTAVPQCATRTGAVFTSQTLR